MNCLTWCPRILRFISTAHSQPTNVYLFVCLSVYLVARQKQKELSLCFSVTSHKQTTQQSSTETFFLRNHKMMIKSMTCHFKGHKYLIEPVCFSPVSKWPDSNQFNRKFLAHYIMPNVRASNLGHC